MSREKIYKMDDGSWLTSDKKEGVGRDKMKFRCSILEREGRQDHYPNCEEVRYRKHESHYFQAKRY